MAIVVGVLPVPPSKTLPMLTTLEFILVALIHKKGF
jgi:hypothetical protein